MFIHLWMHWFWITAAVHFKGFLLLAVHTVSLSEAKFLSNETFIPPTPHPYHENNSSQTADRGHIVFPILLQDESHSPPHTVHYLPTPSIPQDDSTTEESTTTRPDDGFGTAYAAASDMPDTFNGGTLDTVQYPLKKFTKYTHPKYTRARMKGKSADDDALGDERKTDTVKILEENLNVSLTIADDGTAFPAPEVDKHDNLQEEATSEIPPTDAPDSTGNSAAEENVTADVVLTLKPSLTPPTEGRKDMEILKNDTLVIESKVEESGSYTTVEPFFVKNRVAAATSAHNYEMEQSELNAGSITGITLGIVVVFSLFGAVSFVLYRRRYLNKPEVLHDKCSNLDSSGYIDETSLRENSEEMYSLDNDSFLNSLEAMTIQNYWTESVRHTKL